MLEIPTSSTTMAFVPSALPRTRHLQHHFRSHCRFPLSPSTRNPSSYTSTLLSCAQKGQASAASTSATSTKNDDSAQRNAQAQAVANTNTSQHTDKRGFQLLRDDISRLFRLIRGDFSAISAPPPPLFRYDSSVIINYYDRKPLTSLLRASTIGLPFLFWIIRVQRLDPIFYSSPAPTTITERRASQLRALLTWAGPTYLKIGQAIGNRPDLVGAVYSAELQKLVDDVGVFSSKVAREIVLSELKINQLSDVFEHFETEAIASASLGQVHKATLKTGQQVAVKVQRPTVERDAALDVYILRKLAEFMKKRFKLRSDVVGIVDEFASRLWEEIDYLNEADNCERFDRLYCCNGIASTEKNTERSREEEVNHSNAPGYSGDAEESRIYVPKVYRAFTTRRVLCLEWIDGEKPPWFPKDEGRRLVRVGVQCSLDQLLDKGYVHADPHNGNLLRTSSGKLCYLDFGMCVSVPEEVRNDLITAIVRLVNRDFDNLGDSFVKLGFLPVDADTSQLAPLLVDAFGDASTGDSLSDLSFSRLANNLSGVAFRTPIRIPVSFTLIIRQLITLEGLALQTDPTFKIVDEAYPYVVQRILTDDSPVFQAALQDVLINRETGRLRWNRLSALLSTSNRSNSSPEEESIHAAQPQNPSHEEASPWEGVSNKALKRVADFALSDRGGFLRDALVQEVIDTADAVQLTIQKRTSEVTRGIFPAPDEQIDLQRVEQAIQISKLIRTKGPNFLEAVRANRWDASSQDESAARLQAFQEQFTAASRVVIGNIVERNSRRILRRTISAIFGPRKDK